MKPLGNCASVGFGLCLALCLPEAEATTIYSNVGTPTGAWIVGSLNGEVGDDVEAAGADRYVTELDIGIFPQGGIFPNGVPGSADVEARIYANDGPGGQPRTLLWDSGRLYHVSYPGNVNLLVFNVPQVLVPNNFTWTLQFSNAAPYPLGEVYVDSPTVGNSNDYLWVRGAGSPWQQLNIPGIDNLMAQVVAVPEPRASTFVALATAALWWHRRTSLHAWRPQALIVGFRS
jgi:hypothetical protein